MAKQNKQTKKPSTDNKSNDSQVQSPLFANEIKFDNQIDIPNPKLGQNKKSEFILFNTPLNGKASTSGKKNPYFPELEKLTKKINKVFSKKGRKSLLKKQNKLHDKKIQLSITSMNGEVFLTYTKP